MQNWKETCEYENFGKIPTRNESLSSSDTGARKSKGPVNSNVSNKKVSEVEGDAVKKVVCDDKPGCSKTTVFPKPVSMQKVLCIQFYAFLYICKCKTHYVSVMYFNLSTW